MTAHNLVKLHVGKLKKTYTTGEVIWTGDGASMKCACGLTSWLPGVTRKEALARHALHVRVCAEYELKRESAQVKAKTAGLSAAEIQMLVAS